MELFITIIFITSGVGMVYVILRSFFSPKTGTSKSDTDNTNPDMVGQHPFGGHQQNIIQSDSFDDNNHTIPHNHDHQHISTHNHNDTHTNHFHDHGSSTSYDSSDSTSSSDSGASSSFE